MTKCVLMVFSVLLVAVVWGKVMPKQRRGYSYGYGVSDPSTGDMKSHTESRDFGGMVRGEYTLREADGSIRVVRYTAHPLHGFQARVTNIPHTPTFSDYPSENTPKEYHQNILEPTSHNPQKHSRSTSKGSEKLQERRRRCKLRSASRNKSHQLFKKPILVAPAPPPVYEHIPDHSASSLPYDIPVFNDEPLPFLTLPHNHIDIPGFHGNHDNIKITIQPYYPDHVIPEIEAKISDSGLYSNQHKLEIKPFQDTDDSFKLFKNFY